MKKTKATFYLQEDKFNIVNQQKNKSEYINNAIQLYSNLERQLPKLILNLLINYQDEITLSYLINNKSSLYNDNSLIDNFKESNTSSFNINNTKKEEINYDYIEKDEDEEVLTNLKNYL